MKSFHLMGLSFGLLFSTACLSPPVESPNVVVTEETKVKVEQNLKNKVDLLFMVDNSGSMAPKQSELKARFPQLIKKLKDFADKGVKANYHIGVVTSDVGAGRSTVDCKVGGDGGRLQAVGKAAAPTCKGPSGANYIEYDQINTTDNLPAGQSLEDTFTCMASVGQGGCGFEMQLESVYKALKENIPENKGFLRQDAILAVVFVTDEDDCSAPGDSDLFDPEVTNYGPRQSFRCIRFGIQCGGTLVPYSAGGPYAGCTSATMAQGGKLYDIQRYTNIFTQPVSNGGVKLDPNDIILAGITAPSEPFTTVLSDPNDTKRPMCAKENGTNCQVVIDRSCQLPANREFFGDPGVRVNAVINSAVNPENRVLTQICDQSYEAALTRLGDIIEKNLGKGCIKSPIDNPADPTCVVEDVTANLDGTTTTTPIASCAKNGDKAPCWKLEDVPDAMHPDGKCDHMTYNYDVAGCAPGPRPNIKDEHYNITIFRAGMMAPPSTFARVSCATLAIPQQCLTVTPVP